MKDTEIRRWAGRLLPYRGGITTLDDLLNQWRRELKVQVGSGLDTGTAELTDDYGNVGGIEGEQHKLKDLLRSFNTLFEDPNASTRIAPC
jgi:hypothetical protein